MVSRARKRWRGRIFLSNGSERTKVFDTKREALAWEAANRDKPVETVETLAAYIERTRDQVLDGLSASTAATYRSHLSRRIMPTLGHRKMAKIHAGHVEAAAVEWKRSGVSASVVVGSLNCLSRFYRHAIKSELLSANPVQTAERPKSDPSRNVPTLTASEVAAVVARCAEVKGLYGDYVRLAASLGLRAGELTALRATDVDLSQQVVTVRQAYSAGKLGPPRWGRSRQVLIVGEAREVLTRRLAGRRREALVLRARPADGCITRTSSSRSGGRSSWLNLDWLVRISTTCEPPRSSGGFALVCR